MSAWSVLEPLLVLLIVAACMLQALRRLAPAACRRARIACALALLRSGRLPLLQQLGRRLAPAPAFAPAGAQRSPACAPCGGCEKGRG